MSRQELHSEGMYHDGPQNSYSGYEGTPHQSGYSMGSISFSGQKLSEQGTGTRASAGQRLALAIVSLALLVVVIFGLVLIAVLASAPPWAAIPILMIIFLFGTVASIINVVFNRGH